MSIRGGTIRWLDAALDRGDLLTAWTTAHELPPGRLSLDYALALVILASAEDADRADRAIARWLARAAADIPADELRGLARVLDQLPDLVGVTELSAHCERRCWPRAASTLNHLLPGQ